MRLYLSRQANGLYMLTGLKPKISEVGKTGIKDLYLRHGDPIGVRNLCEIGSKKLFNLDNDLPKLHTIKIHLHCTILS